MPDRIDPQELRSEFDLAEIDVTARTWDTKVNFGIFHGHVVEPDERAGVLVIDGEPSYSAAWL